EMVATPPAAEAPKPPSKSAEMKAAKTEMFAAPSAAEAPKPSPKSAEMKIAKTEMMPGLSKEEALKLAKAAVSGEAPAKPADDLKGKKTEFLSTPALEAAKPAPKADDMKIAKTEVLAGLSKDEALRIAREAVGAAPAAPPP